VVKRRIRSSPRSVSTPRLHSLPSFHPSQVDLAKLKESGLYETTKILKDIKEIKTILALFKKNIIKLIKK